MIILGVETSCDDTCVAIVEASGGWRRPRFRVRANIVSSQVRVHRKYGGVVPLLASREHAKNFVPVLRRALHDSRLDIRDCDLVAVTTHPGLLPTLLVGVHAARTLAWALRKPIVGVNHLYGHVIANLLSEKSRAQNPNVKSNPKPKIQFPIVALVVSGGHTQLLLMKDLLHMSVLGETRDDAAGEAFDKVAKLLGLPFPGGPPIATLAVKSQISNFEFRRKLPRPMIGSGDFDFSFSGLKTAVLYLVRDLCKARSSSPAVCRLPFAAKAAVCAEFQQAVVDVLVAKTINAAKRYRAKTVLLGGGVAANDELRRQLGDAIARELPGTRYLIPEVRYALDNAAMIAAAAYLQWSAMTPAQRRAATWRSVQVR